MKRFLLIHCIFSCCILVSIPAFGYQDSVTIKNLNTEDSIKKNEIKSDSTKTNLLGLTIKNIPIVIQEKDSISFIIGNIIRRNPIYIDKPRGIEYHFNIFTPDPNTDYKILKVVPDTTVDYKILIHDPK